MKKSTMLGAVFTAAMLLMGCAQKATTSAAYMEFKPQCLGVELDGSQTLVVWAEGRNLSDAVEQAKKNAVYEVLFNGIHSGSGKCEQSPVVNVPNARDRYSEYFNRFFVDGGEYKYFVSLADERHKSRKKQKYQYGQKMSVTVRVERAKLADQLRRDGILK